MASPPFDSHAHSWSLSWICFHPLICSPHLQSRNCFHASPSKLKHPHSLSLLCSNLLEITLTSHQKRIRFCVLFFLNYLFDCYWLSLLEMLGQIMAALKDGLAHLSSFDAEMLHGLSVWDLGWLGLEAWSCLLVRLGTDIAAARCWCTAGAGLTWNWLGYRHLVRIYSSPDLSAHASKWCLSLCPPRRRHEVFCSVQIARSLGVDFVCSSTIILAWRTNYLHGQPY